MRSRRILAAVAMALFCASCADRTVTVTTPMRSARPVLDRGFSGVLGLKDGDRLRMRNASWVDGWVCGDRSHDAHHPGGVCIASDRISALEATERRLGAATLAISGVLALVFSPLLAAFAWDDHVNSEKNKESERRNAEERYRDEVTSAAQGLPPFRERRAGAQLARCTGLKGRAAEKADAAIIAREIVRSPRSCLDPAINYYRVLEEPEKAFPLVLTKLARARFEALACGESDPGLRAPGAYDVIGASNWMAEYRAAAQKTATYDYEVFERQCWLSKPGADPVPVVADRSARRAARRLVTTTFPLTDFQSSEG